MTQKNHSYRKIFAIALPMIASAISVPLLGIVDTAILGHLDSPQYLAAINMATTIFNILFWGFGFLKMSTTGLIAQSYGKGNFKQSDLQLSQALGIALFISIVIIALNYPIAKFSLFSLDAEPNISHLTLEYYHIRIFSAPATLMIYVFMGYFLAISQAKKVLSIMLVNQVGNMLFDYLLVIQFPLGMAGVAFGSLLSEYLALLLAFYYLAQSSYKVPKLSVFYHWLTNTSDLKQFFALNRDIFIRTLCLMLVFALMTKGSSRLGEITLAANAVLLNFFYFMSYATDGFAHAVESLCGQAYGRGDKKGLVLVVNRVFIIALTLASLFSLVYLVFGEEIVRLLTSLKEVQNYASQYLLWLAIIPMVATASFVYDGVFVATTQGKIMRNSMLLATFFAYLPLWYLLQTYENHGLWLAFLGFFIVRTTTVHVYFKLWIKTWK